MAYKILSDEFVALVGESERRTGITEFHIEDKVRTLADKMKNVTAVDESFAQLIENVKRDPQNFDARARYREFVTGLVNKCADAGSAIKDVSIAYDQTIKKAIEQRNVKVTELERLTNTYQQLVDELDRYRALGEVAAVETEIRTCRETHGDYQTIKAERQRFSEQLTEANRNIAVLRQIETRYNDLNRALDNLINYSRDEAQRNQYVNLDCADFRALVQSMPALDTRQIPQPRQPATPTQGASGSTTPPTTPGAGTNRPTTS